MGDAGLAISYFGNLFSKDELINPQEIVDLMEPAVTAQTMQNFVRSTTMRKLEMHYFRLVLSKRRVQTFSGRFFQRNWALLKEDVVRVVKEFFRSGIMPEGVNDTCIVLIPKVPHLETLKDFRPISLCNVIYKVVSKCIVNRLRPLLQDLISPNQSAFIPGRMITDNALIGMSVCILSTQMQMKGVVFVHINWIYPRRMTKWSGAFYIKRF
jgi:hypothetical protein